MLSALVYHIKYFFISNVVQNVGLIFFINYGTKHKKDIYPIKSKRSLKDYIYFCSSTFLQSYTHHIVQNNFISTSGTRFFLVYLFIFEIILDFFHYMFHRILHIFPLLYPIHKTHHRYVHPQLINTFYHNPIDLILVDCIPCLLSFYILKNVFNPFQLELIMVYKSFIEISGHSGKQTAPSSCFPLCVWLPRFLGIELYTENHDLHHSSSIRFYSKRFSLWDRVFGTN